jgi:hypothetical protein
MGPWDGDDRREKQPENGRAGGYADSLPCKKTALSKSSRTSNLTGSCFYLERKGAAAMIIAAKVQDRVWWQMHGLCSLCFLGIKIRRSRMRGSRGVGARCCTLSDGGDVLEMCNITNAEIIQGT